MEQKNEQEGHGEDQGRMGGRTLGSLIPVR